MSSLARGHIASNWSTDPPLGVGPEKEAAELARHAQGLIPTTTVDGFMMVHDGIVDPGVALFVESPIRSTVYDGT